MPTPPTQPITLKEHLAPTGSARFRAVEGPAISRAAQQQFLNILAGIHFPTTRQNPGNTTVAAATTTTDNTDAATAPADIGEVTASTVTDMLHADIEAQNLRRVEQLSALRNAFMTVAAPAIDSYRARREAFKTACHEAVCATLAADYSIPADATRFLLFDNITISDDGLCSGNILLGDVVLRFAVRGDSGIGLAADGNYGVTLYADDSDTPLPAGDGILARLAR
jgi:hypothetical protein